MVNFKFVDKRIGIPIIKEDAETKKKLEEMKAEMGQLKRDINILKMTLFGGFQVEVKFTDKDKGK